MNTVLIAAACSVLGQGAPREVCVTPNATIPDNTGFALTVPIVLDAPEGERVGTVAVDLEILHGWVGDLVVTLRSPSGTSVTLLNRAGIPVAGPSAEFPGLFGCGGRDIDARFADSAAGSAQDICSTTAVPVLSADVAPSEPLSALGGEPAAGVWLLSVEDRSAYDTGVLVGACLSITTEAVCAADLDGSGTLDFFDLSMFLATTPDWDGSTGFDFFDLSAFLSEFGAGCP